MIKLNDRGAWFGEPLLKERTVGLMKRHRELDHLRQGLYQALPGGDEFRGCAVGCLVEISQLGWISDDTLKQQYAEPAYSGAAYDDLWHQAVQDQFGIPASVARSIDNLFEHQGFEEAGQFAVAVLEAIPVGADLSGIPNLEHTCNEVISSDECFLCNTLDDWYENPSRFVQALASAPLVPAARALILVG